jgi:hypothetical protein
MNARRRLATMAVAVGGVLAGHWLTYLVVAPIAGSRAMILHQTGHSYIGLANDVALVAALTAMASMFIAQLTNPAPAGHLLGISGRVVRFQVCAFVALEVLERVTAGSPVTELIRTGILPIGIAAQLVIGMLAAFAIRWLLRAADRVAAAMRCVAAPPRRDVSRPILRELAFVPDFRHLSAAGVRGPPSPV